MPLFGECADRAGVGRTGHIVIGHDDDIKRCSVVVCGCDNRLEMAKVLGGPSSEPVISENKYTFVFLEDRWNVNACPAPLRASIERECGKIASMLDPLASRPC